MADSPVVHIGENSPEYVAYKLMHDIARSEGRFFTSDPNRGHTTADRQWVLSTYRECLEAVRGYAPD